jgi:hypothetical protein
VGSAAEEVELVAHLGAQLGVGDALAGLGGIWYAASPVCSRSNTWLITGWIIPLAISRLASYDSL